MGPQPSVIFDQKSGEYGSERSVRGVPSTFQIQLDIKKEDCVDVPFTNPTQIKERLEKYKISIDEAMGWTDKELEMLNMTLRDSYSQKPLTKANNRIDVKSWSIIMNMDMLRFQVEETDSITVTNMIAAHANEDDLCKSLEIDGNPRQLLEGACFYRNWKAMSQLALISGCDLDQKFKASNGKMQNCLGLIQADRKQKRTNEVEMAWKAHKQLDELRLMGIAYTDLNKKDEEDEKCC